MAQNLNVLKFVISTVIIHSYKLHKSNCNVSGMYDDSYVNNRNMSKKEEVISVTVMTFNTSYIYLYKFTSVTLMVHNRRVF